MSHLMISRLFRAVHLQFLLLTIITEAFFQGLTGKASFTSKLLLGNICSPIADELNGWNTDNGSEFLEKYWQKKPVLIRNAFPDIKYDVEFLTEADMFNLSYDEDVESRTLIKDKDGSWNKEYGPFDSRYTKKLPANDWTILVQEVDRHIPRVADIWQKYFNFIPSWRRDDIMVSYAAPGGGIGAHVDSYDVFLIQGRGKRIWSIENRYISDAEELRREVPNCDTRLISDFQADQEWELNEGDVLYLPPRIPHQGISLGGGCTTVSMGFKSPTHRSMMTALCDYICQNKIPKNLMYSDKELKLQLSSGYISKDVRNSIKNDLKNHVLKCLDDDEIFDYWLGKYLTVPLRMQLRKSKPFFLLDNDKRSLRKLLIEKGLGNKPNSRLNVDTDNSNAIENDENSNISSILSTGSQNYEDDDDEYDEEDDLEPIFLNDRHRVASKKIFKDIDEVVLGLSNNEIYIRRTEGIKLAYIEGVIFVNGEGFDLPSRSLSISKETVPVDIDNMSGLGSLLCDQRMVTYKEIVDIGIDLSNDNDDSRNFLLSFIECGYFYPVDV